MTYSARYLETTHLNLTIYIQTFKVISYLPNRLHYYWNSQARYNTDETVFDSCQKSKLIDIF